MYVLWSFSSALRHTRENYFWHRATLTSSEREIILYSGTVGSHAPTSKPEVLHITGV